jgi:hypothetical protein
MENASICMKCRYHLHRIENEAAPEVWYNHRCGHPTAERRTVNYTLGIEEFERAYCRDMNPGGRCTLFEAKA